MVPEVLVRGWTPPVESVRMWMYCELRKVATTECANRIFGELTMKKQGDLEYRLGRSIPSGRSPGPSTKAALECHENQKEIAA
jgi:hypothetical protein